MATHVSHPVQSFYCATVRASIWRNEGTRGAFHAITLSRTFMDAEGHPKSAGSFGNHDLSAVAIVVLCVPARSVSLRPMYDRV